MNPFAQAQELARRFNKEEAVWQCYEEKRARRKLLGALAPLLDPLPEETLDDLDWLEAERECRQTQCLGKLIDSGAPAPSHL